MIDGETNTETTQETPATQPEETYSQETPPAPEQTAEPAAQEGATPEENTQTPAEPTPTPEPEPEVAATPTPEEQTTTPPTPEEPPVDPNTIQQVTDTVTKTAGPEVVAPTPPLSSISAEDSSLVAQLKVKLEAFSKANNAVGVKPADFTDSAKKTVDLTNFVVKYPKVPVLDALLAFFKENIDGVCSEVNFMKGSTTLSRFDEQRVGYLYNIFAEMAKGIQIRINTGLVSSVLKPEIVGYYSRRMAALAQGKK